MENFLSTNEIAEKLKVKPDSVRHGLCADGHYLGIRPIKLSNRRLMWPATEAERVLNRTEPQAVVER